VLALALQRRPPLVAGFSFVALLGLLNLLALTNGGRLALHHDWGAVRCLLEFSLGILVYEAHRRGGLERVLRNDASFTLILLGILFGMSRGVRDILIVPGFAALVLCAARNDGRVARLFAQRALHHLGEISYSIYMVNILVFQVVHFAWAAAGRGLFSAQFSLGESWLAWLGAMALVVATAHTSHRWIERPARAWLRRRDLFGRAEEREARVGSVASLEA